MNSVSEHNSPSIAFHSSHQDAETRWKLMSKEVNDPELIDAGRINHLRRTFLQIPLPIEIPEYTVKIGLLSQTVYNKLDLFNIQFKKLQNDEKAQGLAAMAIHREKLEHELAVFRNSELLNDLPAPNNELNSNITFPAPNAITSAKPYFVGEQGTAWQFPSDHLPVGGSIRNIHFALWNVLNTQYLHWIEKNGQGLKDSFILKANVPSSENPTLTEREAIVIEYTMKMLTHPVFPRSVIALEEVGGCLFKELSSRLPDFMHIFPGNADEQKIEDVFIVDTRIFDILNAETSKYTFTNSTIEKITLREKATGFIYCFIQSHVPGGPKSQEARKELAEKVMQEYNAESISIVLGDMNGSPNHLLPKFEEAAKKLGLSSQPYTNMDIPYPTHINTRREASWIDNVFISTPYPIEIHAAKDGSELLENIQPTIDLLDGLKPPASIV